MIIPEFFHRRTVYASFGAKLGYTERGSWEAKADSYVLTGCGLDPLLYLFSILSRARVNDERCPHR